MSLAAELAALCVQAVADMGSLCTITAQGAAPREARMIISALSSGGINARAGALSFVDKSTLPPAADYGYGLLLAADAPEGMRADAHLHIADSLGRNWENMGAKPISAADENGLLQIVAWRISLRGGQRMAVRGK